MIAYIPARGGSQRIPKKNIKKLDGVPVLSRVIRQLKQCRFISHVCVSTDDRAIARVALLEGAYVGECRSKSLADHKTGFSDLLKKDFPRFQKHFSDKDVDGSMLLVLATAALVPAEIYRTAFKRYQQSRADILFSVKKMDESPYRALSISKDGLAKPLFPPFLQTRSQDLPQTFLDAGLFYFIRSRHFASFNGHWFNFHGKVLGMSVPENFSVDVDTPKDWQRLETKARPLR